MKKGLAIIVSLLLPRKQQGFVPLFAHLTILWKIQKLLYRHIFRLLKALFEKYNFRFIPLLPGTLDFSIRDYTYISFALRINQWRNSYQKIDSVLRIDWLTLWAKNKSKRHNAIVNPRELAFKVKLKNCYFFTRSWKPIEAILKR